MARVEVIAAGDSPDAITPAMRASLEAAMAQQAGVAPSLVTLRVVQASLLLTFEIVAETLAASVSLTTQLAAAMPTPDAAQAIINAAGVGSVTIVSAPTVTSVVNRVLAPASTPTPGVPPPPVLPAIDDAVDDLGSGGAGSATVLIIPAVAAVLLVCGAVIAFLVYRKRVKRRSRGSEPRFSSCPAHRGPVDLTMTNASDIVEIDLDVPGFKL